ncbi:MAG: contact-dependent growth inhibition system immunity protein [Terracidiphilus sp.]|jgi:hypothetical protein
MHTIPLTYHQAGNSGLSITRHATWDFTEICDRFPRLEYLFGAFFLRYWHTAQTDPKRVLDEFLFKNPATVEKTARELFRLIELCSRQSRPEDAALKFLEELDCPYFPPYECRTAIAWLREVYAMLGQSGQPKSPAATADYGPPGPIDSPAPLAAPVLPLHLVYELLAGCDRPIGAPSSLNSPTLGLPKVMPVFVETTRLAHLIGAGIVDVIELSASIERLKEVFTCQVLS